jgi:hypothetical protein
MTSDGAGDVCFSTEPPTGGAHVPIVVDVVPAAVLLVVGAVVAVGARVVVVGRVVGVVATVLGGEACLLLDPHAAAPAATTSATSTIDTAGTRRTASR